MLTTQIFNFMITRFCSSAMKCSLVLGLIVLMASSCQSLKTSFDYDRSIAMNELKTFAFDPDVDRLPVNDLVRKRLIQAVTKNLEQKGFKQAAQADVIVLLEVTTKEKEQTYATSANVGGYYGRRFRFGTNFTTTQFHTNRYTEGTLIISIANFSTNDLIWQGRGTSVVREKNLTDDKIEQGVNKIMASFPVTVKK